jgi:hypothetical protein
MQLANLSLFQPQFIQSITFRFSLQNKYALLKNCSLFLPCFVLT